MTQDEAIRALETGKVKKIKHLFFEDSEYLHIGESGEIETGDNIVVGKPEAKLTGKKNIFWQLRDSERWHTDWHEFKDESNEN